jgi:hypothetical protein
MARMSSALHGELAGPLFAAEQPGRVPAGQGV